MKMILVNLIIYDDDDHQEKDGSEAGLAVQMALSDISEMAEQGQETAEGIEVENFFWRRTRMKVFNLNQIN